jgi:hypothetical protein
MAKGGQPPEVQQVDPTKQAQAQVDAQLSAIPQAAQLNYDVLTNPTYGITPTTQAYENARLSVYPEETKVRNQLVQNTLNQLQSPTGITPEQQAAIDARRKLAQNETTEALRTRANLGGGLFGGRAQNTEQRAVQELQNQFVEEDVTREERSRLNSQQLATTILQMLYPNSGVQTPNYVNPVADANTAYSATSNANITNANNAMAQYQADQQLRGSLYSALGSAVGQAAGGFFTPVK